MKNLTAKTELGIDPKRLHESVKNLLNEHPLTFVGTRQLALQHRPGASDPWYEGCQKQSLISADSDFTELHHELQDSYLGYVFSRLPFRPIRTRIMALDPQYCYSVHQDLTPRYHLAVTTNEHAWFVFVERSEALHIPADGNLYYVDTRHLHSAFNGSGEMRIHIVFGADHDHG